MVQPATTTSVKGDFTRGKLQLRGAPYALRERDGVYYITESYLTGKPQEHRVDYTLGNRRIQHYLTTLPSGRVIVLAPSWDVLRKQWFHNFDIADPDETSEVLVQVWNKNCYSCHVSQQEKNFDTAKNEYKTVVAGFRHQLRALPRSGQRARGALQRADAARRARRATSCCRPGSTRRATPWSARSATPSATSTPWASPRATNYYDYFLPILESTQPVDNDPAYWPDGRTRRFSNDAFGLWQSECYLKGGLACTACHAAAHETEIERNPQLRPDANALCTRCHEAIGKALTAHTHHAEASTGSSCVECHMPRTVLSIKAEIRDHSMSIPVPENTIHHGIPNACNLCHKDRDARWSLEKMNGWYGDASRQKWIRRADAFAAAGKGDAGAIPKLLEILSSRAKVRWRGPMRSSHLARFPGDPRVFPAMRERARRRTAAGARGGGAAPGCRSGGQGRRPSRSLAAALGDPVTTVRVGAAVSLVSLGVKELPGEDGERFEQAKQIYRARAEFNSDDAEQQMGAGRFYLLTGDPARALTALQASLRIDPEVPARYLLAAAYVQQGQVAKAREVLLTIPPDDADYAKAQRLLKAIDAQGGVPR